MILLFYIQYTFIFFYHFFNNNQPVTVGFEALDLFILCMGGCGSQCAVFTENTEKVVLGIEIQSNISVFFFQFLRG